MSSVVVTILYTAIDRIFINTERQAFPEGSIPNRE